MIITLSDKHLVLVVRGESFSNQGGMIIGFTFWPLGPSHVMKESCTKHFDGTGHLVNVQIAGSTLVSIHQDTFLVLTWQSWTSQRDVRLQLLELDVLGIQFSPHDVSSGQIGICAPFCWQWKSARSAYSYFFSRPMRPQWPPRISMTFSTEDRSLVISSFCFNCNFMKAEPVVLRVSLVTNSVYFPAGQAFRRRLTFCE